MADPNSWQSAVADLDRRLQRLERTPPPVAAVDLWAVEALHDRLGADGALIAGSSHGAQWQVALTDEAMSAQDWSERAGTLAALANPVRLHLLQLLHSGVTTAAELADDPQIGTTGQLHHHLRALAAGGWLHTVGRGRYEIPPARVVPLLCLLLTLQ